MACLVNSSVDSILEEYRLVINHHNILYGNIIYILRNKTKKTKEILLLLNLETILPNYNIILQVIKNYKKIGSCSNNYARIRLYNFCKKKFILKPVTSEVISEVNSEVTSTVSTIQYSTCVTQCVATQTSKMKYISARTASRSKKCAINFVNNKYKSLKIINASLLLKIDDLEKKNVLLKRNLEYNKKANKIMKKVIRDNNLNIIIANVINEGIKDTTPCIANNTDADNDCGGDCDDESEYVGGDDDIDVGGDDDDMYDDDDGDESEYVGGDDEDVGGDDDDDESEYVGGDDVDMCDDEHNDFSSDNVDDNNVEGNCDKSSMHVDDDKSVSDVVDCNTGVSDVVDCNKIVSDIVDCNKGFSDIVDCNKSVSNIVDCNKIVSDIVDCNKSVTDILDCNKSNNIIHNYATSLRPPKRIRKPNSKFL